MYVKSIQRGDAAIHLATRQGNQLAVIHLRDHNANLDLANALGDTAAILAVKHGDRIIVRILAEAGADLSLRNKVSLSCQTSSYDAIGCVPRSEPTENVSGG